jgi:AraC-like DNA-binding protein
LPRRTIFWSIYAKSLIAMTHQIAALPVPASYARVMLQRVPQHAQALLAGTGLTLESLTSASVMSVAQLLQMVRHAQTLARHPAWAIEFGQQLNISSHGSVGFAAVSAPTLGEGLAVFGQFARSRAPFLDFATREDAGRIALTIDTQFYPLGDLESALREIVLRIMLSYIDAVIGSDVIDVRVCLRARPAHAAQYPASFLALCEFDAPYDGISLPASLKALPCPLSDAQTYAASLARCREALDAVLHPGDIVARSSHWLAARFERFDARGDVGAVSDVGKLPYLDELAAHLCLTPRTLSRQLAARGTSFTQLLAAEQIERACRLLDEARYTISDIGQRLGYGDAANFGRAFRRLKGVSPGQYRRR